MILKIKSINAWIYYDDVRRIRVDYGNCEIDTNGVIRNEPLVDALILSGLQRQKDTLYFEENIIEPYRHEYVFVVFRGEQQNTEKTLVFDEIMYLCNDEGKTIEKITPREIGWDSKNC